MAPAEMRARLSRALAHVEATKLAFMADRRIEAARMLNEVAHCIEDEIEALDRELSVTDEHVIHARCSLWSRFIACEAPSLIE